MSFLYHPAFQSLVLPFVLALAISALMRPLGLRWAALGAYCAASSRSRSAASKSEGCGSSTPASSRDTSSRPSSSSSAARSEASTRVASRACSAGSSHSRIAEANRRAALSGCSTSWLIAARKRVLLCCAASASRVRSSTRCSRVSLTSRSACSTRL